MKKLLIGLALLVLVGSAHAQLPLSSVDTIQFGIYVVDSVGSTVGTGDTVMFMVTGPKGDSVSAEKFTGSWTADSLVGTNWRIKKHRWGASKTDTAYVVYAKVANIVASSTRYGMYSVECRVNSGHAKSKDRSPTIQTFLLVPRSLAWAISAVVDSTTTLTQLKDTIPKYTWAYDSASAAGGAATVMGRQLTRDVTATTDTLAAARAVWRVNLSTYATDTFPKAGKMMYLAGDSTTYVNQYSVWNVPFTYAFTAGTMGDSLNNPTYVGNVGAVSGDATAADNLETMLDGTGGGTFTVKQLDIGGTAGINGALYVHNTDGPGLNIVSSSSSFPGGQIYNSSSGSTAGLTISGAFGNGSALDLTAFGSGHGLKSTASTGYAYYGASSTGYAMYLNSNGSDAFFARGGGSSGFGMKLTGSGSGAGLGAIGGTSGFAGSFITNGAYGIFTQGTSAGQYNYSPSGVGLVGDGAIGIQASSTDGSTPGFVGTIDSVAGVGSGGSSGSDTTAILALAQNHPSAFYGPTSSGGLTYAVGLYVIDTGANPDEVLQGVDVSIADTGGTLISWGKTNQAGYVQLAADGGTYTIRAVHRPWSFPVKTITVTADVDSTELDGYNSVTGSRCRVYGYITDWGINPTEFATVTFTMPEGVNGSDSAILLDRSVTVETDDDGYFYADLARSSYLGNKQWQVTINYPGVSTIKRSVTVPDATSYKLGW